MNLKKFVARTICTHVHMYARDERVTREEVGEELLQRRVSKRDGKEKKKKKKDG